MRLLVDRLPNATPATIFNAQGGRCVGCQHTLAPLPQPRALSASGILDTISEMLPGGTPPGPTLGRPSRLCEYTGALMCNVCHGNDLAVLPRCVLWDWDFAPRRVCKLAAEFLASIASQPVLCVNAVNPDLYNRVPLLYECAAKRRRIVQLCERISAGLAEEAPPGADAKVARVRRQYHAVLRITGRLRYLTETNGFWAMRELRDLGKGAFAALPGHLDRLEEALHTVTARMEAATITGL